MLTVPGLQFRTLSVSFLATVVSQSTLQEKKALWSAVSKRTTTGSSIKPSRGLPSLQYAQSPISNLGIVFHSMCWAIKATVQNNLTSYSHRLPDKALQQLLIHMASYWGDSKPNEILWVSCCPAHYPNQCEEEELITFPAVPSTLDIGVVEKKELA